MRGFLGWKIALTALVTVSALLLALSSHPAVKGTIETLREKISLPENEGVTFSLAIDNETEITGSGKINITARGDFSGSAGEAGFSQAKALDIKNFAGTARFNKTINLKGPFEKLQADGFLFVGKSAEINGSYFSARAEGIRLERLEMEGSGAIRLNGTEISFTGQRIKLERFAGSLEMENGTRIMGKANKILVGGRIVIG